MKKIALFGGTFDPFTIAHRAIVQQVHEQLKVDKVFVIPTTISYYRTASKHWLTDASRIDVCKKMTADLDYCVVDTCEIDMKNACGDDEVLLKKCVETRRFIDTLLEIKAREEKNGEDVKFYVVIGSDQLAEFKNWYMWDIIANKLSTLIVVQNRNGEQVASDVQHIDLFISDSFKDISSTKIREEYSKKTANDYIQDMQSFIYKRTTDLQLLHTAIFDVVESPEVEAGFCPVKVKSKDWVTIIVRKNGQFLIESQVRYGTMTEVHEFPCGIVEEGEEPSAAACRELKEETGIEVSKDDMHFLGKVSPNPAFMTNMMHYFFVDLDKTSYTEGKQSLDTHEHLTWKWSTGIEMRKEIQKNIKADTAAPIPGLFFTALYLYGLHINSLQYRQTHDTKEL